MSRKVITAEEIRIVDGKGTVRAQVGAFENGAALVRLFDNNKQVRANFGLGNNGLPHMALLHSDGTPAVFIGVLPDRTTEVALFDGDGTVRARLMVTVNGELTQMDFSGDNKQPRILLSAQHNGDASMGTCDSSGTPAFGNLRTNAPTRA